MDYSYNSAEKANCWYKNVCDCSRCDSFCIRHYKMDCLVSLATLEGNQRYSIPLKLDASGKDKDAFYQLRDIQNNINEFVTKGKNLLIYSEFTGNGKTEWAKKLLLSWFGSIWPSTDFECRGLFISMPRLMTAMRENISHPNEYFQHVNENLLKADLVVWDELNYKDMTTFEHDYILNIISQRVAIGKSNVYTTNYSIPVIQQKLGSRLASRIVETSIKIELKEHDKRSWGVK